MSPAEGTGSPSTSEEHLTGGIDPVPELMKKPSPPIKKVDMRQAASVTRLPKPLDDTNWAIWVKQLTRVLKVCGVLQYVEGNIPKPDENSQPEEFEAWEHNDGYAQCLITNNISDEQMIHVQNGTAHEIWTNLKAMHEPRGYQTANAIQRNLMRTYAREEDDIAAHINKLKTFWNRLCMLDDEDFTVSDIQFKTIVASSLPTSWDTFTEPYVGRRKGTTPTEKNLTKSQEFIGAVKEEYLRRKERAEHENPERTERAFYSQGKSLGKKHATDRIRDQAPKSGSTACKNCGGRNHTTDDCWFLGKPKCENCGLFGHTEDKCSGEGNKRKKKTDFNKSNKKQKVNEEQSNLCVADPQENEQVVIGW
jgi:hypothetical protein